MTKNRLHLILSRLVDIKPGEETVCLLLFLNFFLITAPYTIIKSLRYPLLLEKFGIEGLPWGYFLAALITGLVVVVRQKIETRLNPQTLTLGSLWIFTATGLVFWIFLKSGGKVFSLLYWIWAYVLIVVLLTHFWLSVNQVFNPREAKRLIGFFGSGGLLGGVFGGLLTYFLKNTALAPHLMLLACGMFLAGIFVSRALYRLQKPEGPADRPTESTPAKKRSFAHAFKDSIQTVLRNRYLRLLSGLVTLTVIVSTLIDYQFMGVGNALFPSKLQLQGFLGLFFAGLNFMAFFVQLLLTSRFLRDFGIRISLIFTPLLLGALSIGFFIFPGTLVAAVLLKGGEESLEFSIGQSSRELLYLPLNKQIKSKAKVFIDMFLKRFAKALASLLILLLHLFLTPRFMTIPILVLLSIWVIINLRTYGEYKKAVKGHLPPGIPSGHEIVDQRLDIDFTKDLFDTLAARSRSDVLFAMHVYDLIREDRMTADVKKLIDQGSGEVKTSFLSSFFDAEGARPIPDSEEEADERENLITDISEVFSLPEYQTLIQRHADQVMKKSYEAETEKMEIAKAIGLMEPDAPLVGRLEALIMDDSPEVARYALDSASRLKQPQHISAILRRFSHPMIREDAVTSLCRYGKVALEPLSQLLSDSSRDPHSRLAAADAISRIGTAESVKILLASSTSGSDSLDTAIIEALDRMRVKRPGLVFESPVIHDKINELTLAYYRLFLERHDESQDMMPDSTRRGMEKKLDTTLSNIFRLLGLIYSKSDVKQAFQHIGTAYAVELLDNTLRKNHRDWIIPIIEAQSVEQRVRRFRHILRHSPKS